MPKKKPDDVSIGKFDILATYTYAKALLDGLDDDAEGVTTVGDTDDQL
jgi:hypothetical protein